MQCTAGNDDFNPLTFHVKNLMEGGDVLACANGLTVFEKRLANHCSTRQDVLGSPRSQTQLQSRLLLACLA